MATPTAALSNIKIEAQYVYPPSANLKQPSVITSKGEPHKAAFKQSANRATTGEACLPLRRKGYTGTSFAGKRK